MRNTKIIATLGPAVASQEKVSRLVGAGMNVARLNFSHGSYDTHRQFAEWVRAASEEHGRAVALLQDIQGPRIRVGCFPSGRVDLETDQKVRLLQGDAEAKRGEIYIDHLEAATELEAGHRILLADGLIRLEVTAVASSGVEARVGEGGSLSDHKGVAFPDTALDLPTVTEKDQRDLEFGLELEVDLVAASFVASGNDVATIRKLANGVPVIAKIERAAAVANLLDILDEAEGAMVARGDLGVELSLQKLPLVQKQIIKKTNEAGRISITATEMLESMTTSSRPTRAEVTDVANALLDGTDAVMLSGETANGKHPTHAVEVMDIICRETESTAETERVDFLEKEKPFPSAVARACAEAADSLRLPVIAAFTESGSTARIISKYRPKARIVAFTPKPETCPRMALYWGVTPMMIERFDSTDEMIRSAEHRLLETGLAKDGEHVAIVAGVPPNVSASTNLLKLHEIGTGTIGVPGSAG